MWFRRFLFLLFTLCFCINFLCLFIAVVSPYINPKYFWPPALFGLFFKLFFPLQAIFTLVYIWRKNKRGIIVGVAGLLISIPALTKNIALGFKKHDDAVGGLKLMTYNVSTFNWNKDTLVMYDIKQNIRASKPDIICLQEYHIHPKRRKNLMYFFMEEMGYKYRYEYITSVIPKNNRVGQAIFSKLPFHNFTPMVFPNSANGACYIDINLPQDTIRVINVHFQSISLREKEYVLPNLPETFKEERSNLLVSSLRKFRRAFRRRSFQADLVDSVVNNSPYKIILCGDFNDTPTSYLYQKLTKTLDDAYLKTNTGIGSTFAGKIPALRIDYILADPEIEVLSTQVLRRKAGDHYPVVATFNLQKP